MLKIKTFIKENIGVITVFIFANVAVFSAFYFRRLIPFPGDLLVSFFFPWNSGGFTGYQQWTTHKEYLAADAIRQMFVWRDLGFSLIKSWQLPLWNPYSFSGTYLLANLQSSLLYPGNIIYLFLSPLWAWVGNVIVVMSMFGVFTYLYLRSNKLDRLPSVFGALAASSISYLTGWQEILVNAQSAVFLPLILFLINKFSDSKKLIQLLACSLLLAFSIFGGHIQTTVYVYLIVGMYALYKRVPITHTVFFMVFSFLLAGVQLVPTIEAYIYSARESSSNAALLARTLFPWQSLITFFASDFFGNTATFNSRLFNYADARAYMGVTAAFFSIFSLYLWRDKNVRFFLVLLTTGLIFATWPFGQLFSRLNIPVLSSVVPARMIMVFEFAAAILSAYGLNYWISQSTKAGFRKILAVVAICGLVYGSLWIGVLLFKSPEANVSRNNLIIPTGVFLVISTIAIIVKKVPRLAVIGVITLVLFQIIEPAYYFIKHQPFSTPEFVFPGHPVLTYLQKNAGYNRFFGFGTSYLDNNFSVYYRIFSAEGYDPLYIKRYGELIYSSFNGEVEKNKVPRSDAQFTNEDNYYRNRLFDLTGVKYILDKNDLYSSNWEPENDKFPTDKYNLIWQKQKWKVYERKSVMPRVFLADSYLVEDNPRKILDKIYDKNFDLGNTVILEKEPVFKLFEPNGQGVTLSSSSARIVDYKSNKVTINTQANFPKVLFLSDTYYPGWKATIDGVTEPIYRADYVFRAIFVPGGNHEVVFIYDPLSFKTGLALSLASIGFFVGIGVLQGRRRLI